MQQTELTGGIKISRIVNGLWQIADVERSGSVVDKVASAKVMDTYVRAGLGTFDMADHYGSAEELVGFYRQNYAQAPGCTWLTKWVPSPGPVTFDMAEEAVKLSMKRMSSPYIDLLQFHAWKYEDPSWIDALIHLSRLQDRGWIRALGLTNFDAVHLKMVLDSGFEIASNQVSYSILDRRAMFGLGEVCGKYGVKLLAFGVLAGGFLTEKWYQKDEPDPQTLQTWSEMKYHRYITEAGGWGAFQNLLEAIHRVAGKHRVSMANVACRWVLDRPEVAAILIGTKLRGSGHIGDNLEVFNVILDEEDRDRIHRAQSELILLPGDCGDEYRKPPFLTASGDLSHHLESVPPPYDVSVDENGVGRVNSGTQWEDIAGFSRAIRTGSRILVSGTTATHRDRVVGGSDIESQAHFIFDKIEGALQTMGASLEDVIRTRIYLRDLDQWETVSRVHGIRMAAARPANTLIRADLVGNNYLVEIEAEAFRPR